MADTISRYNHTLKLLYNGEVDLDNLKVMLLDGTASFTASHTSVDSVAGASSPHRAKEVYDNGWTEGGELLDNLAVTVVNTNGAMIDADDIEVPADGGDIGPAKFGLIYDATSSKPLWLATFDQERTANDGTPFKLTISANGIHRSGDPA